MYEPDTNKVASNKKNTPKQCNCTASDKELGTSWFASDSPLAGNADPEAKGHNDDLYILV